MTDPPFAKLTGDLAAIAPLLDLPPSAAAAMRPCKQVPEGLAALESGGFLAEAARLFAHALPRREAVWWACMCAAHTAPSDLPQPDHSAREAAETWVRQPTEPNRREAMRRAEAAGFGTPEAWAAVAVFWSGGSMAPEGQPAVPPAPHLAGTAVVGAVTLAAVRGHPAHRDARLARFLESARAIADGGAGRLAPETA